MAAVDALRPVDVMVVSLVRLELLGRAALDGRPLSRLPRRGDRRLHPRHRGRSSEMGFPIFCRGIHPADSLGRLDVAEHDVPIQCGGVVVDPGDLVLADDDGIVIIPQRRRRSRRSSWPRRRSAARTSSAQGSAEGMSVTEAFRRYGVL